MDLVGAIKIGKKSILECI